MGDEEEEEWWEGFYENSYNQSGSNRYVPSDRNIVKEYADILGVKEDDNINVIRSNFKKLSLKWHPDRQLGKPEHERVSSEEANIMQQKINQAFEYFDKINKNK